MQAASLAIYGDAGRRVCDESAPAGAGFPVDVCLRWEHAFPEFPRLAQIHPSSWDAKERLKIMDDHGIAVVALGQVLGG